MSNSSSILAFGFVTPAFAAAGVLLVSVPIIIHILNRRRFKTVQWAAMTFLLQALRKHRRRLRFEQWLLLAVRCGVLMFLGLALARPMGCDQSSMANLAGRRAGLHVFIIDNSYSMMYEADRPDAKTHLDQAKLLAKGLIDRLSAGGESVAIITAARPATAIISKASYDLDAAKSTVDHIEQSYSGTDLLGALKLAQQIGKEESAQPAHNLYLLTDSTHSALETPQAEALVAAAKDAAAIYKVTYFNLAKADQWNHAVLSVKPTANLVRSDFPNDFQADVRGFGGPSEAQLQWKLDDQPLPGGGQVKLELNTPLQTQSQSQIKTGGLHVISANLISDNRLKADDTRWRVIDVASELKVLIVEGERGVGPLAGSGSYLQLALAPPSDEGEHLTTGHAHTTSYVQPELISDLELSNKVLGDYRAIILTGVAQITPQQADQLKAFVQQGGTLMIFMGEPVNADSYNQVMLPRGLMPGTLSKRMSVTGDQKPFYLDFKPFGSLHPLLSMFKNQEKTGLDTAQIFTYWQLELPPDSKAQRVLDFLPDDKGHADPAFTVHDLGSGRVVFCATSAGVEWSFLPAKPNYVALMHELLAGTVSAGDSWLNKTVGDKLEIPPTIQLTTTPTLKDPQQVDLTLQQVQTSDGRNIYQSPPLKKPGLYTLFTGNRTMPVAVNVPDDEADIRPLDAAAIQKALGGISMDMLGDQLPLVTQAAHDGKDYGWSVMLIVLALVGLECFLAMRFGHYRR